MNMRAVRAFIRVWKPIGEGLDVVREMDAGFDGGEFSGPANDRHLEMVWYETLTRVAERFGMTGCQLDHDVQFAMHVESERAMDAKLKELVK